MRYLVTFVVSYVSYIILNYIACCTLKLREFDLQYALTSGISVGVMLMIVHVLLRHNSSNDDEDSKQ